MALTAHQGLVEQVLCVRESACSRLMHSITHTHTQAKVVAGTKVLVNDCTSALGAFALQYAARALGAVCTGVRVVVV
jgi:NADPH:quinone reductase-like Zn-dependent oxidoreductase